MREARVALVTGSTSGVGLAIAEALAGEGMDVMLNGPGDARDIEQTCMRIAEDNGVRVRYVDADMSKPGDVRHMIESATREMGRIDVLVNNAAIQHSARVQDFPAERWDAILATNLSAAFHATAAVLPQMLDRGWGRIVNIASVPGLIPSAEKAASVAAEHGVLGLTKVVALETAPTGVTCNAICPGWVVTAPGQRQVDPGIGRPEQVGALTAFLCSEDAAQIRGAALPFETGRIAQ